MAVNSRVKKHVSQMLDCLQEQHVELQGLLHDYVGQVTNKARDWMEGRDQSAMTFNDVNALISGASAQVIQNIDFYSDLSKNQEPGTKEVKTFEFGTTSLAQKDVASDSSKDQIQMVYAKEYSVFISRLEAVEHSVSSINEKMQGAEFIESGEEFTAKQNDMKRNFEKQVEEMNKNIKEKDAEIGAWKVKVENQQAEMENKITSLEVNLDEQRMCNNQQLKEAYKKIKALRKEINVITRSEQESGVKVNNLTTTFEELEDKMALFSSSLNLLKETCERKTEELEKALKQIENLDTKYSMVCDILHQRCSSIDKLNQLFNNSATVREQRKIKFSQFEVELSKLSSKVGDLQKQGQLTQTKVGFTATYRFTQIITQGQTLDRYGNVICNVGSHFNPDTGEFTAPVDGMYVARFTWRQVEAGELMFAFVLQSESVASELTKMTTDLAKTAAACDSVVVMKCRDKLFVRALTVHNAKLSSYAQFSCFLVAS